MAAQLGTSPSMVQRVWKAHRLQPHRTKTFKLSNNSQFAEKLVDVAGLYLNPPECRACHPGRRSISDRRLYHSGVVLISVAWPPQFFEHFPALFGAFGIAHSQQTPS